MPWTEIVEATEEHARAMAPLMREVDVREVRAARGQKPLEALLEALRISTVKRALFLGSSAPAAIYGVAPTNHELIGCAWLLGTDEIRQQAEAFLSVCRPQLESVLSVFPVLCNWVDERNTVSIRWLKHLGARFGCARPYGAEGLPFVPFTIAR